MDPKKQILYLNTLHILNDGLKASLLLFLPFIANELLLDHTQVGFLGTSINSMDMVLAMPAGYIASRLGGLKTLIVALLLYATGYVFTALSPTNLFVSVSFLIAGFGFGMFHPVSFAQMSHTAEPSKRGRILGDFTALGDVGRMAITSVIPLFIGLIGWRYTALSIAIIIYFIGMVLINLIKKDKPLHKEKVHHIQVSYRELFSSPSYILAILSFALDTFASSSLFVFLPFLFLYRNISVAALGLMTSTFFLGNMIGKLWLGRMTDKIGVKKVFIFSEIFMALCIVLLANTAWIPIIIVSSILLGMFTKGTVPVLTSMLSESVEHHRSFEKAFAVNALFTGAAAATAPLVLGYLTDVYGIVIAFNISAAFALLATVPTAFSLVFFRRHTTASSR